ncbi:MAG TPA: hypothetical protein VEA16_02550 [Vicinamibacterales bacterium]|nr:hypothetical protein [Vicinamibacterales bacterium]
MVGCEAAKSANPTAPSVAGPIPGVNITAPRLLEPYAGSTLVFDGEPQTLLIENAGTSGARTLWLELQVGTDQGFQQIVYQADRISLGDGGRTTHRLTSALSAGYTYYWRTRAVDGANSGPYSEVASFSVIPPAVIDAPVAISPSGKLNTNKPEFRVTNGAISGTSGVAYRFELSTAGDFSNMAAVVTVPVNGSGSTTMTVGELPYKTTFYWRVRGTDGAKESSYSNTQSFTTSDPPAPPPSGGGGVPAGVPTGSGGRAAPGGGVPSYGPSVVNAVAAANPGALRNSCQDHGGSWQFMDMVVDTLRTYDTRWGYNGKRGSMHDASHDAIAYNYGGGADLHSTEVYIIDIIGGHCGSNPTPAWIDVTGATRSQGTIGRWLSRGRF